MRAATLAILLVAASPVIAGLDMWTAGDQPGGGVGAAALVGDTCYAAPDEGLFRSSDGCRTWAAVPDLAGRPVMQVAIDVMQPATAYAATVSGVWRTLDAGASWIEIDGTGMGAGQRYRTVAVNPEHAGEAFFGDFFGGVWYTDSSGDGPWVSFTFDLGNFAVSGILVDAANNFLWVWSYGAGTRVLLPFPGAPTWESVNDGLSSLDIIGIGLDRGAGRLVLATTANAYTLPGNATTWTSTPSGLPSNAYFIGLTSDGAGAAYAVAIGGDVFTLPSGGSLWFSADTGLTAGTASQLWADPTVAGHVLAETGGISAPVLGQGSIWRTIDGGRTWSRSDADYNGVRVNAVAADPANPGHLLAATDGNAVQRSSDAGLTWASSTGITERTVSVAFDPTRPGLALVTLNGGGVRRSLDGGATWGDVVPGTSSIRDVLAVDGSGVAFTNLGSTLAQSSDGGLTWAAMTSGGFPTTAFSIRCIGLNPADPGTVWVGTSHGPFVLTAGAPAWLPRPLGVADVSVEALAFDAAQPATVYAATLGEGVWRSTDGGEHWERASTGIMDPFVESLLADPRKGGTVYAVAGDVYRTTDGGTSWTPLPRPSSSLRDLAADADGHTLYGATFGQGVLALTQSAAPVFVGAPSITGELRVRSTLRADPGIWDAAPAPTFAYEWLRCRRNLKRCKTIRNATASDYRLVKKDARKRIQVRVTARNASGQATAESAPTDIVKRGRRR